MRSRGQMAQFCQRKRESDRRADYCSLISRLRTELLCRDSQEAPKGEIPVTYYGIEEVIKSSFGLWKTSDTTTQTYNEDLVYMCKYIHFVLVFQKKCHNYLWKTRAVWLHVLVGLAFLQLDTFCQCLEHVETGIWRTKPRVHTVYRVHSPRLLLFTLSQWLDLLLVTASSCQIRILWWVFSRHSSAL